MQNFGANDAGREGRGKLGKWGPNRAVDAIVTRIAPSRSRMFQRKWKMDGNCGLQVAVVWREEDQCWALPGKFVPHDDSFLASTTSMDIVNGVDRDKLQKVVRSVFEIEHLQDTTDEAESMMDELFEKVCTFTYNCSFCFEWQPLQFWDDLFLISTEKLIDVFVPSLRQRNISVVFSGLNDDPRNTNNAWVETTACHTHLCGSLQQMYVPKRAHNVHRRRTAWLNVHIYQDQRVELYHPEPVARSGDGQMQSKEPVQLWSSHNSFIKLAILGSFIGHPDLPFVYNGEKTSTQRTSKTKFEKAVLDCNHSHYILIDNGTSEEKTFGSEIAFRNDLETFLSYYDFEARMLVRVYFHCFY